MTRVRVRADQLEHGQPVRARFRFRLRLRLRGTSLSTVSPSRIFSPCCRRNLLGSLRM